MASYLRAARTVADPTPLLCSFRPSAAPETGTWGVCLRAGVLLENAIEASRAPTLARSHPGNSPVLRRKVFKLSRSDRSEHARQLSS